MHIKLLKFDNIIIRPTVETIKYFDFLTPHIVMLKRKKQLFIYFSNTWYIIILLGLRSK